ncbi:MAG: hypothetical protein ACR2JM_13960 [Mycobacterium sp.]
MINNAIRRMAVAVGSPIVAVGVILAVSPEASANPMPTPQCSSMAMVDGQAGVSNPNPLTRAGQVGAATAPDSDPNGAPMECNAVGHG